MLQCGRQAIHFVAADFAWGLSSVEGEKIIDGLFLFVALITACWILDGMFSQVLTPKLQAGCEITYVVSASP